MEITVWDRVLAKHPAVTPTVELLRADGHRVTHIAQDDGQPLPKRGVWWLNQNPAFYPGFRKRLAELPLDRRQPLVVWHWEPLLPPRSAGLPKPRLHWKEIVKILLRDARATDVYTNASVLRRLAKIGAPDVLAVSGQLKVDYLAEQGIAALYVPLGAADDYGADLGLERDIDVLFLGALDVPRRGAMLDRLRKAGVRVTAVGSWNDPNCWGEARTRLLNRTKILLNFARTPAEFSGMRLLLGMRNKVLVLSEPMYKPAPYIPGEHFVMAGGEGEMPGLIRHYLAHEEERQRVAECGYAFAVREMSMRQAVRKVVGHLRDWAARRGMDIEGDATHGCGIRSDWRD
jgi:hypothetical protein